MRRFNKDFIAIRFFAFRLVNEYRFGAANRVLPKNGAAN
jgi:hypothetical protein